MSWTYVDIFYCKLLRVVFSGHCNGAGIQRRHGQPHDHQTPAVPLENGPPHRGSDEPGRLASLSSGKTIRTVIDHNPLTKTCLFHFPSAGLPAGLRRAPRNKSRRATRPHHHGDLCGPLLPGVCHHQAAKRRLSLQVGRSGVFVG